MYNKLFQNKNVKNKQSVLLNWSEIYIGLTIHHKDITTTSTMTLRCVLLSHLCSMLPSYRNHPNGLLFKSICCFLYDGNINLRLIRKYYLTHLSQSFCVILQCYKKYSGCPSIKLHVYRSSN